MLAAPGGHRDPEYLRRLIDEQRITAAHFVPSMLAAFLADAAGPLCPSLRRVICSGEELPRPLAERFFEHFGCELLNLYGPTEAAVHVTAWRCEPDGRHRVPIGRPCTTPGCTCWTSGWSRSRSARPATCTSAASSSPAATTPAPA